MDNPKKQTRFIFNSITSFHKTLHQAAPVASASYSLIASLLLFIFIGVYVDNYFGIAPLGTLIGLLIGLVIGFYQLIKIFYFTKK